MAELTAATDPVAFSRDVLRIDPWPHQEEPLRSTRRNVTVAGGRRSGKSQTAQIGAIHVAATRRDAEVLVVLPNIDNGRAWLREASAILHASKLRGSVVDEQAQSITFSQGGVIRVLPATAGQLRGRGRKLLRVILEESGFLDPEVMRHVSYALLDNHAEGAQLWQVGSPWGGPDHPFRVAFERGLDGSDEDYASFRVKTTDNPLLPVDYIERERARLSPAEAAAELDGVWQEAIGSLFSRALLAGVTASRLELPSVLDLEPPALGMLGIDYGVVYDASACCALYRLPLEWLNPDVEALPRFVVIPKVWAAGTPLNEVWGAIVDIRARFAVVTSESNGVGASGTQEIGRILPERKRAPALWNACASTAAKKAAAYTALLTLMEKGQLILPPEPTLLRELAGLRYEQGEAGLVRIGAEVSGGHDDCADSLMLAAAPYVDRRVSGRVSVQLLKYAQPYKLLDARPSEGRMEGIEIVETGAGLRLPVRPVLQSVTDWSLSYPPRVNKPTEEKHDGKAQQ